MHILTQVIHRRLLEAANADGADGGAAGGDSGADGAGGDQGDLDDNQRAEVEQRARDMGWSPKENWRGNPNSWIDAPEFVQRGEQVLPILQANLRKGEAKLSTLETQLQRQAAQLQEAHETIRVLTDLSTEQSRAQAKERRRELLRQQADARREGDTELEVELGEQIADVTSQINAAEVNDDGSPKPRKGAKTTQQQQSNNSNNNNNNPTADPQYQQWQSENPWFGTDRRKTALATAIAEEIRTDPNNASLVGKAFFDRVTAEVNKVFAPPTRSTSSKVEGGGATTSNNSGGGGSSNGKSYADLPADAKSACERQAKMLVGEGKAFKDIAAWRKHYAAVYFDL